MTFKWTLIAVKVDPKCAPTIRLTYEAFITNKVPNPYFDGLMIGRRYTDKFIDEQQRVEKIEYLDHPNEDVRAFFIAIGTLP